MNENRPYMVAILVLAGIMCAAFILLSVVFAADYEKAHRSDQVVMISDNYDGFIPGRS